MTAEACGDSRQMRPSHYALIGLAIILGLPLIISLPGWIAAGIWGMHIFLRAICIFWLVAIAVVVASVIWIALDPHSR